MLTSGEGSPLFVTYFLSHFKVCGEVGHTIWGNTWGEFDAPSISFVFGQSRFDMRVQLNTF